MNRKEKIKELLSLFPCVHRDQVARFAFSERSDPILKATQHMQEYRKEKPKWVTVMPYRKPFVYMAYPKRIHDESSKTNHWLEIVGVYIDLVELQVPFEIYDKPEVNIGDGYPQVDLIFQLHGQWIFAEIQRTKIYKGMQQKIKRYEEMYINSGHTHICEDFTIWICSKHNYEVRSRLPIIQTATTEDLVREVLQRKE